MTLPFRSFQKTHPLCQVHPSLIWLKKISSIVLRMETEEEKFCVIQSWLLAMQVKRLAVLKSVRKSTSDKAAQWSDLGPKSKGFPDNQRSWQISNITMPFRFSLRNCLLYLKTWNNSGHLTLCPPEILIWNTHAADTEGGEGSKRVHLGHLGHRWPGWWSSGVL